MKDASLLKQHRTVTYHGAQHTQDYVTGFKISQDVHKKFMERTVELDIRTQYHGIDNFMPYEIKFSFCTYTLGTYNPARFDFARFSYDRFSTQMLQSEEGWSYSIDNDYTLIINFLNFTSQPKVVQTLSEINQLGTLPALDSRAPNVVVSTFSGKLLFPTVNVVEGRFVFELNVDPTQQLLWYYNSLLTVYVAQKNSVVVDGQVETMRVGMYQPISLDITTEELTYLQVMNNPNIVRAELKL